MTLSLVEITEEALLACLTHAMTTEAEEIMGLLLGDTSINATGNLVSRIWMAYPQLRMDRRKDRVETSPEQMARCSAHAERLSSETGVKTRVVGWYHSHPHITVLPSHVDVRTQAMYQMLDDGFVGLIFSVFNGDAASKTQRVQLTAFQSDASPDRDELGGISSSRLQHTPSSDLQPVNSTDLGDVDSPLKQAIIASHHALREVQGSLVRCEVPLRITTSEQAHERSLHDYSVVQRLLLMEERGAYTRAMEQLTTLPATSRPNMPLTQQIDRNALLGGGLASPAVVLSQLHHASSYQQALCRMVDAVLAPALASVTARAWQDKIQAIQLEQYNTWLQEQCGGTVVMPHRPKPEINTEPDQAAELTSSGITVRAASSVLVPAGKDKLEQAWHMAGGSMYDEGPAASSTEALSLTTTQLSPHQQSSGSLPGQSGLQFLGAEQPETDSVQQEDPLLLLRTTLSDDGAVSRFNGTQGL